MPPPMANIAANIAIRRADQRTVHTISRRMRCPWGLSLPVMTARRYIILPLDHYTKWRQ